MLSFFLVILVAFPVFAQESVEPPSESPTLSAFTLKDQFDRPHTLTSDLRMILFSKEKSANKLVTEVLKEKETGYLLKHSIFYIADVSGMPSFIYSWFALPKMKKYNYSVLLESEPDKTKVFPSQSEAVTILHLNNLNVTKVLFARDVQTIQSALQSLESEINTTKDSSEK
ncbi:MAG: hypothetical protein KDD61_12335 [Bdellovibrionales bacterium]|nr:hypothetical protein [Bdellovibrionales bacterium]